MSLNPRIKSIELGISELQSFTIYPLSLASEFRVSEIISKAAGKVADVTDSADGSEVLIFQAAIEVIKDNLGIVVELVTKKDNRPTLDEIDNVQFSEFAELIFEMNFAGTIKNFQSLVQKIKGMFPSTGLSQSSSEIAATE